MQDVRLLFAFVCLLAIPAYGRQAAPSIQDGPLNIKAAPPSADKDGVYRPGPGITPPMLTNPVAPQVPSEPDGRVPPRHFLFAIIVGADGTIKIRDVRPNDGSSYLDNAMAAVKASTFSPGKLNDVPVPVLVCVQVRYSPLRPASTGIMDCDQEPMGNRFGTSAFPPPDDDPFRVPPGARPPRVIHTVGAEYSDEARRAGYEGAGLVSLIVNEEGLPTEIHIERHLEYGLDDKMVETVNQYRFQPATLDGKPIAVRIRIEISFRLGR